MRTKDGDIGLSPKKCEKTMKAALSGPQLPSEWNSTKVH